MSVPEWVKQLLEQPEVTDLCLSAGGPPMIDRGQGLEPAPLPSSHPAWDPSSLKAWLLEQLSAAGKTWDARYPFVDVPLSSGHRLHAVLPPVSPQGISLSIRRTALCAAEPQLLAPAWKSQPGYELLREAFLRKENILIAGATGCGKTTLLNTLLSECGPFERVLLLEDTPELAPAVAGALRLLSRPPNPDGQGEVSLRALVREALRMRPDRLVIGECRGPEVLDILQALNTGHRGGIATVHASSARDALARLELLALLAPGAALSSPLVRALLAQSLQWVVHLKRNEAGRRISEVAQVIGREGDTILLRPMLRSSP